MSPEVLYQKRGKVAWISLCRPAQGNRLTPAMNADLTALSQAVADDDEVEILALTGTGETFCGGLEYTAADKGAAAAHAIRAQFGPITCVEAVAALTKPTIAVLNGHALGVGLELALACDLRFAREDAQCGLPQIADGLIPFCGGTQRLPRLVGQAKAMEMILTGECVNAREAYRIGLVNEVIAADQFAPRVDEILTGLLGKGPIALRLGKEAVQKAMDLTLDQGIRLEEDLYALLQTTHDRAEGVRAFLEKRTPKFTGH
ncbi:MAG: enoyl-CoA hydratase/isomerase family protein [Thermodesulfobacteriota bacterium]